MRLSSKYALKDRQGETRVVRKFLIFPRTFESSRTRWFEYASIVEEVLQIDVGGSMEWGNYAYRWREIGFASEPEDLPDGLAAVWNEKS